MVIVIDLWHPNDVLSLGRRRESSRELKGSVTRPAVDDRISFMKSPKTYVFSLKGRKDKHTAVATSLEEAGQFYLLKNEKGEIVGQFNKSEVQGYTVMDDDGTLPI
jgi:hypothetical protein